MEYQIFLQNNLILYDVQNVINFQDLIKLFFVIQNFEELLFHLFIGLIFTSNIYINYEIHQISLINQLILKKLKQLHVKI